MKKQAIISDSTAKEMIEIIESKAATRSSVSDTVIDIVSPSGSVKRK
jgi:nicotinamide mononucleotide (NMN) deamidase PncC